MVRRKVLISIAMLLLAVALATAETQISNMDDSLQRANELWEMAIAAKGGRKKLHEVRNLVVSSAGKVGAVDFLVFPDKCFLWTDTRPSKIGLIIEMFNFELDAGYTIFGDSPPDVRKKLRLSQELKSRFLRPQLNFLLETQWLKPKVLRASSSLIKSKRVDLVEILIRAEAQQTRSQFGDYRVGVFLDQRTHLPVRIGYYIKETGSEMYDWVDLSEYQEVAGIKVPTALSSKGSKWEQVQVEVNVEYNPQVFEREPDVKTGPFQWRKAK